MVSVNKYYFPDPSLLSHPPMFLPVPRFRMVFISSLSSNPSFDISSLLLMFQEYSGRAYFPNPCYPEGFNITMKASSIYDTECTKKPKNYNPNQELFMVGTGNSDVCERIVKSIFDFKNCSSSHCSFNGVEQPPVSGDFKVIHSANKTHA